MEDHRRPVDDTNHESGTPAVAAAQSRRATATETTGNQALDQRRPVDANHDGAAGSTVVAAAAAAAASARTNHANTCTAAGPAAFNAADSNEAPKRGDTAPAPNPSSPPSSTNTSQAKGDKSARPLAPTKKMRRACSVQDCFKASCGPRHNHRCKIHLSEDFAGGAASASATSASRFKGTGDQTRRPRPPRQQKTASAFKPSRRPDLGADGDADKKKTPPAPSLSPSSNAAGKNPISFIFKLYDMLDDASSGDPDRDRQVPGASNKRLSDIVAFHSGGQSFKIYDEKNFRSHVLPLYFRKMTFLTYQRMVNHCKFVILLAALCICWVSSYVDVKFLSHRTATSSTTAMFPQPKPVIDRRFRAHHKGAR